MGGRACKTSHLGKNTLKNRRFLESNNADSGERIQGLPKSGVELRLRCRRGAECGSRLASAPVYRPTSATGAAVSQLPVRFANRRVHAASVHLHSENSPLLRAEQAPAPFSHPEPGRLLPESGPCSGRAPTPGASLLSALFPPRLSSSAISSPSFSSPTALTVPHTAPSCLPCSQTAMPLCE